MIRTACSPTALHRTFFALLTLLVAGSAQAEWILLGRNESIRVYIEQNTVQRNGDFVQIWQLMDFATAQWADAQTVVGSIRNLIEYDCTVPRSRGLHSEAYSEQMGDGRLVANERLADAQWESVEPGSFTEKIRQIACARK